jgi:hypothetical protein
MAGTILRRRWAHPSRAGSTDRPHPGGPDRPPEPDRTQRRNHRAERYTWAAEPAIRAAAAKLNGFVLIITHAADPYQLTPDTLMDIFASPLTLAGWAKL